MSVTIKVENDYNTLNTNTIASTDTSGLLKVKKEDHKNVKIMIHQLQDVADELAEGPDIEIKQERISKVEDGLQNPRLSQDIYYYCCNLCGEKMLDLRSTIVHKQSVHHVVQKVRVGETMEPEVDDPNFYCRSCQQNFFFKDNYKKHLLLVHQQNLTPAPSNQLPDLLDPNFFCSVCQRGWKTSQQYRQHCKVTHKMELSNQRRSFPNAIIDPNDPRSYCAQCDRTYVNYRQHLRNAHNMTVPPQ